jgi:hypothetical protein
VVIAGDGSDALEPVDDRERVIRASCGNHHDIK